MVKHKSRDFRDDFTEYILTVYLRFFATLNLFCSLQNHLIINKAVGLILTLVLS